MHSFRSVEDRAALRPYLSYRAVSSGLQDFFTGPKIWEAVPVLIEQYAPQLPDSQADGEPCELDWTHGAGVV